MTQETTQPKYKVGDEVEVVEALSGKGKYYYGGGIRTLPIGTKVEVIKHRSLEKLLDRDLWKDISA